MDSNPQVGIGIAKGVLEGQAMPRPSLKYLMSVPIA
jgi:hypothetical protein